MKLVFVDQLRLYRGADGRVWGTGGGRYSYYSRFLGVFDSVQVVTRIEPTVSTHPGMELCDGPGVTFYLHRYTSGLRNTSELCAVKSFLRFSRPQFSVLFVPIPKWPSISRRSFGKEEPV